jgi:hypothetical protein
VAETNLSAVLNSNTQNQRSGQLQSNSLGFGSSILILFAGIAGPAVSISLTITFASLVLSLQTGSRAKSQLKRGRTPGGNRGSFGGHLGSSKDSKSESSSSGTSTESQSLSDDAVPPENTDVEAAPDPTASADTDSGYVGTGEGGIHIGETGVNETSPREQDELPTLREKAANIADSTIERIRGRRSTSTESETETQSSDSSSTESESTESTGVRQSIPTYREAKSKYGDTKERGSEALDNAVSSDSHMKRGAGYTGKAIQGTKNGIQKGAKTAYRLWKQPGIRQTAQETHQIMRESNIANPNSRNQQEQSPTDSGIEAGQETTTTENETTEGEEDKEEETNDDSKDTTK